MRVVPQSEALSLALERSSAADDAATGAAAPGGYKHILVQRYLEPQLAIGGRSSYLRVWLLVTSVAPLRAYLFRGGFAIFGKQKGANATAAAAGGGGGNSSRSEGAGGNSSSSSSSGSGSSSTDDLIVNLWIQDREKSPIWSLAQLEAHLKQHPEAVAPLPLPAVAPAPAGMPAAAAGGAEAGAGAGAAERRGALRRRLLQQRRGRRRRLEAAAEGGGGTGGAGGGAAAPPPRRRTFADAWADMRDAASLVLAAGLPSMRAAAANASAPPGAGFEYFGLDFVLDASLRPKMLEVNAVPSMARRKSSGCAGARAGADECKLSATATAGAGAAGGGLVDGFDEQKEAFVHDMLKILGLPVDAAPPEGGSSGSSGASGGGGGAADALRAAAAALGGNESSGGGADSSGGGGSKAAEPPAELRKLLCSGSGSSDSSSSSEDAFACPKCLTASDLAALADAEAELANVGRFEPACDLILAHKINRAAAADEGDSGDAGDGAAGAAAAAAAATDEGSGGGGAGVWQRLHRTWAALAGGGAPPPPPAAARLPPPAPLPLRRSDYVMSAWLRARQDAAGGALTGCGGKSGGGGGGDGGGSLDACTLAKLKRLVEHCYL